MMTDTDSSRIAANQELGRRFFQEQDRLRGGPAAELCTADYSGGSRWQPADESRRP